MCLALICGTLISLTAPGSAQTLDPLKAPSGEYIVASRPCSDLQQGVGSLELMEFDGRSITLGAATCQIANAKRAGDVYQASCEERGAKPNMTPLRVSRPSERALSVNGTVYNHCPGA